MERNPEGVAAIGVGNFPRVRLSRRFCVDRLRVTRGSRFLCSLSFLFFSGDAYFSSSCSSCSSCSSSSSLSRERIALKRRTYLYLSFDRSRRRALKTVAKGNAAVRYDDDDNDGLVCF
jgi:hypothetical protein